ncbi:Catalase-1 isoform B [Sphaceloma murrayae]|uniref:Catalase-1 isoform B n=1 Tax=Sphaceloma murrayae TaxID=2082308 RepID=A0A2K1QPL4_9PEZI|nr:Catalase-1 isoform B [Sphaceloma murrayae]
MHFSLLVLLSAVSSVSAQGSPDVFITDLFKGARQKEDESTLNASDLTYTQQNGAPHYQPLSAQRAGSSGPLLLQDTHLLDTLAHFNRERIPERVVHARGAGAHGYFEATSDFASRYSVADVFQPGTRTSITVRFSTVGGMSGSADMARDPRGFAIKFRTRQGILDWVFNNTPIFFIRDPAKFPRFIHTQKTHPSTNARDWDVFWSWPARFAESLHQFLRLFSDLGTPYGFRYMNGWSGHTYRLVQADGSYVYVKVRLVSDQGIRNMTASEAAAISGSNEAWSTYDLHSAIERGDFPSWTVQMAIKTPEEAASYTYDVLDLTKDWFDAEWRDVGRMVLTQNPNNYFAEIEQASFAPSNMVPGWAASADPVLQSRLFAYKDAGRYRLGTNAEDIPVNCPFSSVANWDRDGFVTARGGQGARPNHPAIWDELNIPERTAVVEDEVTGRTVQWESEVVDKDYDQPRYFYETVLGEADRRNLEGNIAGTLVNVKRKEVLDGIMGQFERISGELASGVRRAMEGQGNATAGAGMGRRVRLG